MFGGLAFLVHGNGNMAVSAVAKVACCEVSIRQMLSHEHIRRFELRDRKMDGRLRSARR